VDEGGDNATDAMILAEEKNVKQLAKISKLLYNVPRIKDEALVF
jgi:hypothetical protein